MAFFHAMEGLVSIIIMVSIGYILAAKGWFNQENSKLLPQLINYVALPTYMIWNLLTTFDKSTLLFMLNGIAVPIISMLISFAIAFLLSKALQLPANRAGTFRSIFFCSSSVFVGVPVNLALFGEKSIPYVLVYFLANAILFWTIGNYSISLDGTEVPAKIMSFKTVKRVCSPPLVGFAVAVFMILCGIHLPDFAINTTKYLGSMTTPLSMLFIGITIFGIPINKIKFSNELLAILLGRFVISPIIILIVVFFFPIPELMKKVFVIQAALPAMSHNTVLAKVYGADAEYAALMVAITTLFAVFAIPVYMVIT